MGHKGSVLTARIWFVQKNKNKEVTCGTPLYRSKHGDHWSQRFTVLFSQRERKPSLVEQRLLLLQGGLFGPSDSESFLMPVWRDVSLMISDLDWRLTTKSQIFICLRTTCERNQNGKGQIPCCSHCHEKITHLSHMWANNWFPSLPAVWM